MITPSECNEEVCTSHFSYNVPEEGIKNSPLTGTKTDESRQAKPNEEVEVTVSDYEPLSVEVKTTSVVDGTDRVIKIKQDNIYPGE